MNKPKYTATIISNSSGISEITLTDSKTGISIKQVGEDRLIKLRSNRLKLEDRLKEIGKSLAKSFEDDCEKYLKGESEK